MRLALPRAHGNVEKYVLIASVIAALAIGIPFAVSAVTTEFPPPDDVQNEPVALSPLTTVASGTTAAGSWELRAYTSSQGPCLDLLETRTGVPREASTGGGCGYGVPDESILGFGSDYGVIHNLTWFYGPISSTVNSVQIVLSDGRTISPSSIVAFPGNPLLKVFIATEPGDVTATTVKGFDSVGNLLGTKDVTCC